MGGFYYYQENVKKPYDQAVEEFKIKAEKVEKKNSELESEIQTAQKELDKNQPVYNPDTKSALSKAITVAESEERKIPEVPDKLEEVKAETQKLAVDLDYKPTIEDLDQKLSDYKNSVQQMKQITNPDESWVIQRLKDIPGIVDIDAVTEDNDPNGNLNKAGGYTSTVYFQYDKVNQAEVYGDNLIDKGTEAGGAIEVYKTKEDAEKRNKYLEAFDGSVLSSGSHEVLGTIVIRTSDRLTATQQKDLTKAIVDQFLKVE